MLTVAKGPLAVLPRLPPMDGRKGDKEGAGWKFSHQRIDGRLRQLRPQLQRVLLGRIVIDTRQRRQFCDFVNQQIAFGGMQVAARRVGSKRPAQLTGLLPRRNGQCVFEKARQRSEGDRGADAGLTTIQVLVERRDGRVVRCQARQGTKRRSRVASKRIRLIRPVHVTERARVAKEMMLRLLVVAHDHVQGA